MACRTCQLGNTWVPEFAELDALTPLQSFVQRSTVVDPKDYFQGIWDTNVIHGELVGVPWYVDTRLIYYRRTCWPRPATTTRRVPGPSGTSRWRRSSACRARTATQC